MSAILFDINQQIGSIVLNRPDVLNAFNRNMALLLQDILKQCEEDDNIRVVLITGQGKAFCAGQDLTEVADPEGPGMKSILSEHYNPIIKLIRGMPKPVLAAVNGVAAGAGANIALCCDVVIAATSASFIQAFSKIGLIPDSGGTYFLPRLIGWQKASAIMMLGDKIPASEAEKMGMVYKTFDDTVFNEEKNKIAATLAALPTRGLAYTKQAMNKSLVNDLHTQLELEDSLQQKAALTADYKEGIEAFLTKRKPVFQGR